MDIFGRKKAKFFNLLTERVQNMGGLPASQAKDFATSSLAFDFHWGFTQIAKEEVTEAVIEKALLYECELVMENATSPGAHGPLVQAEAAVEVTHPNCRMDYQFILFATAKIASYLIKPRSREFESDEEFEAFQNKLVKFIQVPVTQVSGKSVPLIQFMSDPVGTI